MKHCSVHLLSNDAPGVETMVVSLAVSISVIGLIIDASIPAGAGQDARNTAVEEQRGEMERRDGGRGEGDDRNGGRRWKKGRHLEFYSSFIQCVTHTQLDTRIHAVLCWLLTYICSS